MTKELTLNQEQQTSVLLDTQRFDFCLRVAEQISTSKFIPDTFKGSPGDCLIALNMADRLKVDPILLMQHMHIIKGKPGIDAQLSIALFNRLPEWEPIEYETGGKGEDFFTVAKTKNKQNGKEYIGPKITSKMVRSEGWIVPKGNMKSKWETMPELMYRYRAASYLIRTICPEATLGIMTIEEIEDITIDKPKIDLTQIGNGTKIPQPEDTPEPDPDVDLPLSIRRSTWINKKSGTFKDFIESHHHEFSNAPDHIKSEAATKYQALYKNQPIPKCLRLDDTPVNEGFEPHLDHYNRLVKEDADKVLEICNRLEIEDVETEEEAQRVINEYDK